MSSGKPYPLPAKHKRALVLPALAGAIIVLVFTARYGAGLSPDSVGYLGVARNLMAGAGVQTYDGAAFVVQPPLYPALLALVGYIFHADPLAFAHIVNALIFAAIVYLGGLLILDRLPHLPYLALAGSAAVAASPRLLETSMMAWSEPLFILFVLTSFAFAGSYLSKPDAKSLALLSVSAALACMTRYIGVLLIPWGVLVIAVFGRQRPSIRLMHSGVFAAMAAAPLLAWAARNYAVSGTLSGGRSPSALSLSYNLMLLFREKYHLYILAAVPLLAILAAAAARRAGVGLADTRRSVGTALHGLAPMVLFVAAYEAFLVILSTLVAYDQIGFRLLSPIYVPLIVVVFVLAGVIVDSCRGIPSAKAVSALLVCGIGFWLAGSLCAAFLVGMEAHEIGLAYAGRRWKTSETIEYLRRHPRLGSEHPVYTNDVHAVYLFTGRVFKWTPARTCANSNKLISEASGLRGTWPSEGKAWLVWFDGIKFRPFLFGLSDLRQIAIMKRVTRFKDGAIYVVERRPRG